MKKQVYLTILLAILFGGLLIFVSSVSLDLNHDGVVNITDLQVLAQHFEGKATYDPNFDLNNNGKVDLFDVVRVARNINLSSNISSGSESNRTVLFHSDWSTSTGNSINALTDGGKFVDVLHPELGNVTSSSGIFTEGFPNLYRVNVTNNVASSVSFRDMLGNLSVGQSRYWRFYLYSDIPENELTNGLGGNHPVGTSGNGDSDLDLVWEIKWGHTQGSNELTDFRIQDGVGTYDVFSLQGALYDRTEYRVEVKGTLISNNGTGEVFSLGVRIYNSTGDLLYNSSDFTANNRAGNPSLAESNLTGTETAAWGSFHIGTNGWGAVWNAKDIAYYWGGAAICDNNWCGPYSNGV